VDELPVEGPVDLVSQTTDAGFDHVGLRVEIVIPYMFHDHGLGDNLPRVAHEVIEQRELQGL
jgi:hypothetical protein